MELEAVDTAAREFTRERCILPYVGPEVVRELIYRALYLPVL